MFIASVYSMKYLSWRGTRISLVYCVEINSLIYTNETSHSLYQYRNHTTCTHSPSPAHPPVPHQSLVSSAAPVTSSMVLLPAPAHPEAQEAAPWRAVTVGEGLAPWEVVTVPSEVGKVPWLVGVMVVFLPEEVMAAWAQVQVLVERPDGIVLLLSLNCKNSFD